MFKKIQLLLLAIILIVIASSCKKDSNGNTIIPGVTTSMTAKINGVDWSSIVRVCTKSGNSIILTGTSLDGKIIEINISPNLPTDSLQINTNYNLSLTSFYKESATTATNDICAATTGTVKLTQLDKTNKLISGTFSFSAMSISLVAASITAGTFTEVSYVGN